jgi:hypothetical protein
MKTIKLTPSEAQEFSELFVSTGCSLSTCVWSLDKRNLTVDKPGLAVTALDGWLRDPSGDECGDDPDDLAWVRSRNRAFNGIIRKLTS